MTRDSDLGVITPAELAALQAYLEAGTTKAAAHALSLSESTVKTQLWHLRSKLGVHSTAQAIFVLRDFLHDPLAA